MKYIVCYSGGLSSAVAAIETVRRYGRENVILLNHNIIANVEDKDIKRFKNDIANYLGLEITFANMSGWESNDQFNVCMNIDAFKVGQGSALCTYKLKVEPFKKWLAENLPSSSFMPEMM